MKSTKGAKGAPRPLDLKIASRSSPSRFVDETTDLSGVETLLKLLHVRIGVEDSTAEGVGDNSRFAPITIEKKEYDILTGIFDVLQQMKVDVLDSGECVLYAQTIASSNVVRDGVSLYARERTAPGDVTVYALMKRLFFRGVDMDVMSFVFKMFAVTYLIFHVYQLRRHPTQTVKSLMYQWRLALRIIVPLMPMIASRINDVVLFFMDLLKNHGFWSRDLEKIRETFDTRDTDKLEKAVDEINAAKDKIDSAADRFEDAADDVNELLQGQADQARLAGVFGFLKPLVENLAPAIMGSMVLGLRGVANGGVGAQQALPIIGFTSGENGEGCSADDTFFTVIAELSDTNLKVHFQRAFTPSERDEEVAPAPVSPPYAVRR